MDQITDRRIDALRDQMRAEGIDLVALGPTSHMRWLAGLNPHGDERPVMVLVSQTFAGVLMPVLNADAARKQTALPFFPWADADGPVAALTELLAACTLPQTAPVVALDEAMRADFALLLLGQLDTPKHQFTDLTVGHLRASKDEVERASLIESARINDLAFQVAFDALKPGLTERELCGIVKDAHIAHGAVPAFCSVCFGENGAFPHHSSDSTALTREMSVLIDAGCRVDGYSSDMTRCGWLGTPSDDYLAVAKVVDAALDAGIARSQVGLAACEIDHAARGVITDAGYGDYFTHRTGHGLGLDTHEPPYLTGTSQTPLRAGHVITVEPGIYLPGKFGIRLEEEVFLHDAGPEVLTKFPRLTVID